MQNKIHYVLSGDIEAIKLAVQQDNTAFLAEIDGAEISTIDNYFDTISTMLKFPIPAKGIAGHNDWMQDLDWLGKERYVFIIHNFNEFLKNDLDNKQKLINAFQKYILPWWQSEVELHAVEGKAKDFQVYFVD